MIRRLFLLHIIFKTLFLVAGFVPAWMNGQAFEDVATEQGIMHSVQSVDPYGRGSGVSFFDFNNDGWDDLTLLQENDSISFFLNNQGVFNRLPSFVYNSGMTKQVIWVDYDNDHDNDLFISTREGSIRLFRNDGDFAFSEVSSAAGLGGSFGSNWGISFADYDKNGFLDFYLCRFRNYGEESISTVNALYRNNGNGTFTNVAPELGVHNGLAASFVAVWIDYNNDTWPDIYVVNDFTEPNALYRNNGNGTFTDVSVSSGIAAFGVDHMTGTFADFDNDGFLDIYHTDSGINQRYCDLVVNNGNGTFSEIAQQMGVNNPYWSWGASWMDANNDGFQDLYVATGYINPLVEQPEVRSYLYMQQPGSGFTDSPQLFTGNHVASSYGVAKGDINSDGFADLIVQNGNGYNSFLWKNSGTSSNHYLKVSLTGTISNRMAIGSWISVYASGQRYVHYTRCGEDFASQSSQNHIFGLSNAQQADSVIVAYPSGHTDRYYNLPANTHHHFTEGETLSAEIISSGAMDLCEGDSVVLDIGTGHAGVLWSTGESEQTISVDTAGSYYAFLMSPHGFIYYSDTVVVRTHSPEILSTTQSDVSCHGGEDGEIILTLSEDITESNPVLITWDSGHDNDSIFNLIAGTYSCRITDQFGCSDSTVIEIHQPDPLVVEYSTTPDVGGTGGSIQLAVDGGTEPYTFFLDGVSMENPAINLSSGPYEVEVTDDNGCQWAETILIEFQTSAPETGSGYFNLYPNPVTGGSALLAYFGNGSAVDAKVFDQTGRQLLDFSFTGHYRLPRRLDLSSLTPGVYTLMATDGASKLLFRLVVL